MMPAVDHIDSVRTRIRVTGRVQGVGFRPFLYRLASDSALSGMVRNTSEGVEIEIEGTQQQVDGFLHRLRIEAPAAASIQTIAIESVAPIRDLKFEIMASNPDTATRVQITPDLTICPDCEQEMKDPLDRRFGYPFLNCTRCGPRYTIVRSIPYDRATTSMAGFAMCDACRTEYESPQDRRFHAQPVACPDCGPQLWMADGTGQRISTTDPVTEAAARLLAGQIIAVRGVGGFHLAVDPYNERAVERLRIRKRRVGKPFALLARSLGEIAALADFDAHEAELLSSNARPIVLLRARGDPRIAASVAPHRKELGFMLAYAPLQVLLLEAVGRPLVMTSANRAEEPIAIGNEEALERLGGLADAFLLHDREILQRCDDSVARVVAGRTLPIRRSRGYVPGAVPLPVPAHIPILAVGCELKNTIALAREGDAFLSQHIGELSHPEAYGFFQDTIRLLREVLEIDPRIIAHDMHPDYRSSRWAAEQSGPERIAVQHHHAHLAAVMAEHNRTRPTIGLILDGTGYGTDGTIWGGEILIGDLRTFRRYAWLRPFALPGGDAAVKQPWRTACSLLIDALGHTALDLGLPGLRDIDHSSRSGLAKMIERKINCPMTSSAGRLFDGISALIGVCTHISYEGEAAILLEAKADEAEHVEAYPLPVNTGEAMDHRPLVRSVVADLLSGTPDALVAARFHATLARMLIEATHSARAATRIETVALSGGVFQNVTLERLVREPLTAAGFEVLCHQLVPPNDGGLSYGQAAVAAAYSHQN